MKAIEKWMNGELYSLHPVRVDAVPVAECNLKCEHCFWPHGVGSPKDGNDWTAQADQVAKWGVPVVYAGRTLTPRGERFIEECFARDIPLGIIDNGYTIMRREDFLSRYGHISISLDGSPEAHDRQRRKVGSFDKAWDTILRLKALGFDPIVSTAFSPWSFDGWSDFEARLRDYDVPMSVALVVNFPETVKRGQVNFTDERTVREGFDVLLSGIPKLINLYDSEFVRILRGSLSEFSWAPSDTGDSLEAETPNGSRIVYYPDSVIATSNVVLRWDGQFYAPWGKEYLKLSDFSEVYEEQVNALNRRELELWTK
ncbi:MAG: radical SAM protein [Candidatus Nomurabacteria bacterium]|nr:MAG: radical SAM protein [Candidatus Nomurabacteria bacterium]